MQNKYQRKLKGNLTPALPLFSEVTMAQGHGMTSRESLHLDETWATDDDDDDVLAAGTPHTHQGKRGTEVKHIYMYLKVSELGPFCSFC